MKIGITGILSFDRAGHQSTDKVTLQREEDDQRQNHADECAGSKQVPVLSFFTHHGCQSHRNHAVLVTQKDQRHQVVIPDPQELEDGKGSQRRNRKRQDEFGENGEIGRTVNEGRFEDVPWNGG